MDNAHFIIPFETPFLWTYWYLSNKISQNVFNGTSNGIMFWELMFFVLNVDWNQQEGQKHSYFLSLLFVHCFFRWSNVYILADKWLSIKFEFTTIYIKTKRKLLSVLFFSYIHLGFCSYSCNCFITQKRLDGTFPVFRVANLLGRFRAGVVTSRYYSVGLGFPIYWLASSVYSRLWSLDVIYESFNEYQGNIFYQRSNCSISIQILGCYFFQNIQK